MLETLNKQQKDAVIYCNGVLRLIAGPGSGKTKVITTKIAYLLKETSVEPEKILAITFTNKAANEMRERLKSFLNSKSNKVNIFTFHSLCYLIIKKDGDKIGIPKNFSILDDYGKRRLIKNIIEDFEEDKKKLITKFNIIELISYLKNNFIDPIKLEKKPKFFINKFNKFLDLRTYQNFSLKNLTKSEDIICFSRLLSIYEKLKKEGGKQDFDDLIINAKKILEKEEVFKNFWEKKYEYILVDEFQDTSILQYIIVKLLSLASKKLTVVGDTDQTIYTWRGADPNIMLLSLEEDFPNLKTIKLEQNYRSTQDIIDKANKLISFNKSRIRKEIFTISKEGEKTELKFFLDPFDEAKLITKRIKKMLEMGIKPKEIAIIFRTNSYSRFIESSFLQENIPYKIINKIGFYDRKVVKDYLDYLRVLFFEDEISFLNIINIPPRGIGPETIKKFLNIAKQNNTTLLNYFFKNFENLLDISHTKNISRKSLSLLKELIIKIKEAKEKLKTKKLSDFLRIFLFNEIKYLDFLVKDKIKAEADDFLTTLLLVLKKWEQKNRNKEYSNFLDYIALTISEGDPLSEDKNNHISCITAHSVKGLEYNYVFVLGLSEKIFPILFDKKETNFIEEERRLLYVAITRAKKKLFLSSIRRGTGKQAPLLSPSRFLKEMGFKWKIILGLF